MDPYLWHHRSVVNSIILHSIDHYKPPFHTHTPKSIVNTKWRKNPKKKEYHQALRRLVIETCSYNDVRRDVTYIRLNITGNIVLYVLLNWSMYGYNKESLKMLIGIRNLTLKKDGEYKEKDYTRNTTSDDMSWKRNEERDLDCDKRKTFVVICDTGIPCRLTKS